MKNRHQPATTVEEAILSRRSIRAFLPTEVPQETVKSILQLAARAPSGTNTQPWKVYVLTGNKKEVLSKEIVETYYQPEQLSTHREEYAYYPAQWVSPYIDRRRKVGWDLYSLLGLAKTDKAGMQAQHARNYTFFDAPVGLMFTIDRVMEQGSWLDYGMFIENVMLAARSFGLDTCPQAAFTQFHTIIAKHLQLPESEMVVCGMSLGFADLTKIENTLETEREEVSNFVKFVS